MSFCYRFGLLLYSAALVAGQSESAPKQRIEISLEKGGEPWKPAPPNLVFQKNDKLRFRGHANFDGYLYVLNYGTSGRYDVLFPREETGMDNRIKAGVEFIVPATKTAFRVDGPPGYDVVYWIVSPAPLSAPPAPPKRAVAPADMTPRCDDSLFRARGLCLDSSAGPRNVTDEEKLPDNLPDIPRTRSRDLVILNQPDRSVISSPTPLAGPVIYEFRVAHQ
jgi:hypothetical protein